MIREGKAAGWLTLPPDALIPWMHKNDVELHEVHINGINGNEQKGLGILASVEMPANAPELLMTVPKRLILSKESVKLHSETDHHLWQVLEALEDFGTTSRGAILTFLLMQSFLSCPSVTEGLGVASPFTNYIKFLPLERLPTLWSEDELLTCEGTSLAPAVHAKMKSLHREYSYLREVTKDIDWCEKYWWNTKSGMVSFDDWLQVDAMYRSRALEFPNVGDAMVPCIDMANHASASRTKALYETDQDGNAILVLRAGMPLKRGAEVTITYGEDKGACEMIFSYGFLEEFVDTAGHIFLDLEVPLDDPLRLAKKAVAESAPGARISEGKTGITWESDFVWLVCVNEEDGLNFKMIHAAEEGKPQLQAEWKGQPLDTAQLRPTLEAEPMWPIYQLRAVATIQDRVQVQLQILERAVKHHASQPPLESPDMDSNLLLARRLHTLESDLLQRVYESLESKKLELLEDDIVVNYLEQG